EGWDVTDELREHGKESLRRIISDAKPFQSQLICAADVKEKTVDFLLHPQIPLKLVTVDGDPGVGKTFATQAFAAGVSLGKGIPGMKPQDPANVLLLNGEDGAGDTIVPRLKSLEADMKRIFIYTSHLS